jgi:serine/threonine protein kinase
MSYEPIVTIVLTYHTFQFYSKCFYHYFELQSNHLLKQKTNYLFQVSSRKDVLLWKEKIETSTPTIYDINRYAIAEQLGKGAFGEVRRAYDTFTDASVAIKLLPDAYNNRTQLKNAIRELRILQTVKHPNIIRFYDVYLSDETLYLVTELCQRDMLRLLQAHYDCLTQDDVILISKQLISAVSYLHSLGIMHRDIKPSNILFSFDKVVKLCDFGMARTSSLSERDRALSHPDFDSYDYSSVSTIQNYQSSRRTSQSMSSVASGLNSQYSEYVVTRW